MEGEERMGGVRGGGRDGSVLKIAKPRDGRDREKERERQRRESAQCSNQGQCD